MYVTPSGCSFMICRHTRSFSRMLSAVPKTMSGPSLMVSVVDAVSVAFTEVTRSASSVVMPATMASALLTLASVQYEPTAGLDPHARLDVWEIVREQADSGVAVVLATHSFEEADRVADDIVIMGRGRVRASGTRAEVTGGDSLETVYFSLTDGGRR